MGLLYSILCDIKYYYSNLVLLELLCAAPSLACLLAQHVVAFVDYQF